MSTAADHWSSSLATKRSNKAAATDGDTSPQRLHHALLAMEVTGGFLAGLMITFADGLNCIIGGRGTGKTTVLELLRYALTADLRADGERVDRDRERLEKERLRLVQSNLGNGLVRVTVRTKHGTVYRIERMWNEPAQVVTEKGEPTTLKVSDVLKVDAYSQSEIEEIATNPGFQLELIDKFEEEEFARLEEEISRLLSDLAQNALELLQLERDVTTLAETSGKGGAIAEKLKELQAPAGPDAEATNRAHAYKGLRERERKAMDLLRGDVQKRPAEITALVAQVVARVSSRVDRDFLEGPNAELFRAAGVQTTRLASALEDLARRCGEELERMASELVSIDQQLADSHARQELAYRELIVKLNEEQGRAQERSRLQKQQVAILNADKDLRTRQADHAAKLEQRKQMVKRLTELRLSRYRLRKQIADQLSADSGPLIRVSVEAAGDRQPYRELLKALLKSTPGVTQNVDKLLQLAPRELAAAGRRGATEPLTDRAGLDPRAAKVVIERLRASSELLYQIEAVELEDVPRIELLDGAYKDSADLSTGQRCTAILSILLLDSDRPLLVDQPEDNLDNRFIYETVVRSLVGTKGRRQLVFVSHNPNVPLLGLAERVFVMGSDGKHATVSHAGTVDERKDEIELNLEGGKEAFQRRMERYGY